MIGLFDSGHGGLTIFRTLVRRFPDLQFVYLGDHANAPYGNRDSREIVDLTRNGVEHLYTRGCKLVVLACNTASAVACRTLQQDWLPGAGYAEHNILGVVAPVVEAATQTPWAMTSPQYPQKYNTDTMRLRPEKLKRQRHMLRVSRREEARRWSVILWRAVMHMARQIILQTIGHDIRLTKDARRGWQMLDEHVLDQREMSASKNGPLGGLPGVSLQELADIFLNHLLKVLRARAHLECSGEVGAGLLINSYLRAAFADFLGVDAA